MSEVHVAVAVILNDSNEVLISLRPNHVHQGGFWEFPGGKVEENESVRDALNRELLEELGIQVTHAEAYKTIRHNYVDKSVKLDVWIVRAFSGMPSGMEGQLIKWMPIHELQVKDFPEANKNIVLSLALPAEYMITGEYENKKDFFNKLKLSLEQGIRLVQLRCKGCSDIEYLDLARQSQLMCERYNANLMLNASLEMFLQVLPTGFHLTSQELHSLNARPVERSVLLSASCHNVEDIKQANKINVDIVLLSPVKETESHPGVQGIGWNRFAELIKNSLAPAYALGGMGAQDMDQAQSMGAQGVAAIRSFWCSKKL